ncbi:MAG: PTS sugar transporter subunit IIC [Floccifex porci]|uniref:PTS sugar transporter subunit IIC n=1 Tax=Floccifex porci TaxID=2606629 RepID=A0A7X2N1M7_9FIRM|nr:PTS sugar transporter subunit IIC [Floccifex porci]MCI7802532.1 PTS sugar transporter subunit IIC [Erysipelotrichaceae bacterium]MDD7466506.1 PTS sugar transporter subunit IIC [Floccifex porci]MDY4796618.1 PTS sugar transporter subunit IIC [Floccifex porci]MSS00796.1 PTS sugar transporter subunit IIC [Floccifex porci]
MNVIEIILLAIVTFIFAIDQFSLTEIMYRPIVACPIIGMILGDVQTGLVIGGTYELMMIGNMPVGGAQPPNAVLGSVVAMIFAVKAKMDINAALGACMIFATFGQYVVTLTFTVMSGLMAKADKAAEQANPKGITAVLNTSMCILGGLFAVIAIIAYVGGVAMSGTLEALAANASWFMGGLSAAGGMMRFVGFAILLKIMLANDMWGYLLAGFVCALVIGNIAVLGSATLLLVAFLGIFIALNDFRISGLNKKIAEGGMSDGI